MKQHSPQFLNLVQSVKPHIAEITPQQLKAKLDNQEKFYLIDVREESEWAQGHIPGARHLSKGVIERDIEKQIADFNAPLVVYCSGGFRSCLAAYNLQKMGYTYIASLAGGMSAWVAIGLPVSR